MPAGGAVGEDGGAAGGLGGAVVVGGAAFDGVAAGWEVEFAAPHPPGVGVDLRGQSGGVPRSAVGADFDAFDADGLGPGGAGDGGAAGGDAAESAGGVDAGLDLDGGEASPAALDPVGLLVEGGEFEVGEPFGGGDVAVEAGVTMRTG
ncbi:hypothetical protein GCM10020366_32810 [Saccharopolyspora gregorii]|uniref:Uncharacterized protein n=1 Tax=Saccharopolyspora gregorii TaxID=33914 RepID=A0ABP6RUG1_9PSEU